MKKLLAFTFILICLSETAYAAFGLEAKPQLETLTPLAPLKLGYSFYESFHYNLYKECIERVFLLEEVSPVLLSYTVVKSREGGKDYEGLELPFDYNFSKIDKDVKKALQEKFYSYISK